MIGTLIVEGGGELVPLHRKILSSALQSGHKEEDLSWSLPEGKIVTASSGGTGMVVKAQVSTVTGSWRGAKARER